MNDAVQRFYEHYGFQPLPTETYERRLFLPVKTVERSFAEREDAQWEILPEHPRDVAGRWSRWVGVEGPRGQASALS